MCWVNMCCGLGVTCECVVGKRDLNYTDRGLAISTCTILEDREQMLVGMDYSTYSNGLLPKEDCLVEAGNEPH